MRLWVVLAALVAIALTGGAAEAQTRNGVTLKSAFCKNAWKQLFSKPSPRAMAVSKDGQVCHSAWGYDSQKQADKVARDGCQDGGERSCVLFR